MNTPSTPDSGFAQAEKYAEDLVKLFALEKDKRAKLELTNQKLQAVFSATPDGLAVLDQDFNIEEANPAFWTLIEKQAPKEKESIPLNQILPYPDLITQLKKPLAPGQNLKQLEIDIDITESVTRTLQIVAAPLSAGNLRGLVLIIHDLTEQKRLETLKNEFINIAAHELRTPLAAILGFSQVLKDNMREESDDLSIHLVNTILKSGNRLKGIIDELIEFADIHYERDNPQSSETFNLITVIEQVIESLSHNANENDIIINAQFAAPQIEFTGTQSIIKDIVTHLIENAITYNNPGGIVTVRVLEKDNMAVIEIEDNGIGIAKKEFGKIFDKFYQVQRHLTRSVGGLGLGLAIVQRGVNLHAGNISIDSTLGRGSRFTVKLPKTLPANTSFSAEGLKLNYRQTIAFGKDLAKAVASERVMAKKLKTITELSAELLYAIDKNQPPEVVTQVKNRLQIELEK